MNTFLLFLLYACAFADIPIISYNGSEEKILGSISPSHYEKILLHIQQNVESQLMKNVYLQQGRDWDLSQVVVGLGASGEIGVGPWKLGTTFKQRFIFVRKP
jgi:hypothetical protein